jgi:hypothetical protein
MDYFDYSVIAREAHLSADQLRLVENAERRDYPHDRLLFELHVRRACRAIRDGIVCLAEVLADKQHA